MSQQKRVKTGILLVPDKDWKRKLYHRDWKCQTCGKYNPTGGEAAYFRYTPKGTIECTDCIQHKSYEKECYHVDFLWHNIHCAIEPGRFTQHCPRFKALPFLRLLAKPRASKRQKTSNS